MRENIELLIRSEFGALAKHFEIFHAPLSLKKVSALDAAKPGVYIFVEGDKIVKVGRHLTNARKRSLEHVRDNTGKTMKAMMDRDGCELILITLKTASHAKLHWVCALEVFLETQLEPSIRSGRKG